MADQTLAKLVNERSILTLLRASGGSSRAAIARALSLTPATISRLTADMVRRGLLREVTAAAAVSTEREPGRPGIKVAINPEGAYFLGVEIGVSVMRFVLLDLCANVAESVEKPLDHHVSAEEAVSAIDRAFRRFGANPKYRGRIRSAGVTVPGLVTTGGHVVNLPILGWRETDLHGLLSNGIPDLSFSIENNANAAAFGAIYTKPESQEPCTVFLKLGTGCGGAAIVNGRLLRGAAGTAMEPGHINVGDPGAVCNCGQRGCLETWVNLTALARGYLGREPTSNDALANLPSQVADELSRNNPAAIRALDSITAHLSTGLISLVNIFNPSQIVLGGAMRPVLQHCLQRLRDEVSARIIPGTLVPDIRLSHLGIFECAIGAACISHHNAFDISNVEIAGPFQPAQSPQSTLVTPSSHTARRISNGVTPAPEAASSPSSPNMVAGREGKCAIILRRRGPGCSPAAGKTMNSLEGLTSGTWLNPPPHWHLGADGLTFETGMETDFWRDTLYSFRRDSGHALLVPVTGDFTAHLTFEGDYQTLYDQAGLMLRRDEKVWLKAGIEYSDSVPNMSVVVTRGRSDWSTFALPMASGPQRLRLTRTGADVVVQFRNDDRRWQLLRVADFTDASDLLIGPMACSPQREGFEARFTEFTIGPAVAEALHDESPA